MVLRVDPFCPPAPDCTSIWCEGTTLARRACEFLCLFSFFPSFFLVSLLFSPRFVLPFASCFSHAGECNPSIDIHHFSLLHHFLRSLDFHRFSGGGGSCRRQGKSAAPDGPAWWRWLVVKPSHLVVENNRQRYSVQRVTGYFNIDLFAPRPQWAIARCCKNTATRYFLRACVNIRPERKPRRGPVTFLDRS